MNLNEDLKRSVGTPKRNIIIEMGNSKKIENYGQFAETPTGVGLGLLVECPMGKL